MVNIPGVHAIIETSYYLIEHKALSTLCAENERMRKALEIAREELKRHLQYRATAGMDAYMGKMYDDENVQKALSKIDEVMK